MLVENTHVRIWFGYVSARKDKWSMNRTLYIAIIYELEYTSVTFSRYPFYFIIRPEKCHWNLPQMPLLFSSELPAIY